jgi:inactivated superfamily I helicase
MEDRKRNKSSNYLVFKVQNLTQNLSISSNNKSSNLNKSNDKKSLFDFISSKNRMVLKSCFDHKGTKKFLLEKAKAMQEINLSEDIKEEKKSSKKDRIKSHIRHVKHHHSNNHANKLDKNGLRSSSTNDVLRNNAINLQKNLECEIKKIKKLSDKTNKYSDIEEDNNKIKYENKLSVNKKRIVPFNSISSNFSNIKVSEPLNLAVNKNDSLIHSIVNEMSTN